MSPSQSPSPPPRPRSGGRSCLAAAGIFLVYLLASAFLLLLPTGFIGPVFVMGGFLFVCVIGLHYFVWGRWLSRVLSEDANREEDQPDTPDGLK